MKIIKATWGITDGIHHIIGNAPTEPTGLPADQWWEPKNIIPAHAEAKYIVGANTLKDVTEQVNALMRFGRLDITASNDHFGDPAVGTLKCLIIDFEIDGAQYTCSTTEGEEIHIPEEAYEDPGEPANFPKSDWVSTLFLENGYNTDKYYLGYLDNFYDKIFPGLRKKCKNLLEIGCQYGESIRLWRDYFDTSTTIYGADINDYNAPSNTYKVLGDAYSEAVIKNFQDDIFDVIIDDGPHSYASYEVLIPEYYSKLKEGGVIIIEDIIRPNELEPLKQIARSRNYQSIVDYDMTGLQKTSHLYNLWKGGIFILILTK